MASTWPKTHRGFEALFSAIVRLRPSPERCDLLRVMSRMCPGGRISRDGLAIAHRAHCEEVGRFLTYADSDALDPTREERIAFLVGLGARRVARMVGRMAVAERSPSRLNTGAVATTVVATDCADDTLAD